MMSPVILAEALSDNISSTSTVPFTSQLIDTFVVQFVGFVVPGKWAFNEFLENAGYGYLFKLLVAFALIPFIYLGHFLINNYLRENENRP